MHVVVGGASWLGLAEDGAEKKQSIWKENEFLKKNEKNYLQ